MTKLEVPHIESDTNQSSHWEITH